MAKPKSRRALAERLGARVRLLREERGLTQEELAWSAGLSKSYLSLIEAGKRIPTLLVLSTLAYQLGLELADFFAWDPSVARLALLEAARRKVAVGAVSGLEVLDGRLPRARSSPPAPPTLEVAERTEPGRRR